MTRKFGEGITLDRVLRAAKRAEVLRKACESGKHYFPWRPGEPACLICGKRLGETGDQRTD